MGHRILVVDDQLGVRKLLLEAFKDDGYDVELAASGQEAIEKVSKSRPEIILMDMKMPGMNGLDTLAEIEKIEKSIEVVIMTAYGELELVVEAKKMGIKEYITKPFDINELKDIVKRTIKSGTMAESSELA